MPLKWFAGVTCLFLILGVAGIVQCQTPDALQEQRPASPDELERRGLAAVKSGLFEVARRDLLQAVPVNDVFDEDGNPRYMPRDAAYQLGVMLRDGLGGPRDARTAGRCFVLALGEEAPLDAYLALADLYRTGKLVPRDRAFAELVIDELLQRARNSVWWHRRKADAIRVAQMLIQGEILPRDLVAASNLYYVIGDKVTARALLEQAAKEGVAQAHWMLGGSFLGLGWPVTDRDPQQAETHFRAAGELGMMQAWFDLGMLYREGTTVPKDEHKAFECFQKSGNFGAYFLGMAYWEGLVTSQDVVKARHFLLIASTQDRYTRGGLPILAKIYREGLGVKRDPVLAARYAPLKAFIQVAPPAAPKAHRPWEGDARLVVDIEKLLLEDAPAESWLEYGKALKGVSRIASAAMALERAKSLGSVEAEWELGRLFLGDWGVSGDEMSSVLEPLHLDLRKGEAFRTSAKAKGFIAPKNQDSSREQDLEQQHRKAAQALPAHDPRQLFHLIRAWDYSPKD